MLSPTLLSPAHTAGTYSIYIPITVCKGTLVLSPPHQYLWQARTPAWLCRGRSGAGCSTPVLPEEQTKALSSPYNASPSSTIAPVSAFGEGARLCTHLFPSSPPWQAHAGPVQVPMAEVVGMVQGEDAQGSPPGPMSGWDLRTPSPRKALEGLYPPSFHRRGKGMKDKDTIISRLRAQSTAQAQAQSTAEQWQPSSIPPPAKASSKMRPWVLLS